MLDTVANLFDRTKHQLDEKVVSLVNRMRALDADRIATLSIDGVKPDGSRKIGQYEFLCGVVDTLTNDVAQIDGRHQEILSFIFGRPIHHEDRPASAARMLFDEIWYGSADRPNPNVRKDSQDAVVSIAYIVQNELEEPANNSVDTENGIPF